MKLRNKIISGVLVAVVALFAVGAGILGYSAPCEAPPSADASQTTMRAALARCYGSADVITQENVAVPELEPDEVLVRVRAAAVNPLDWHYMRGSPYLMRLASGIGTPADPRMGVDFAGTVEAVGTDVSRYSVGDEVFGGRNGAFSEYVAIREASALARKPDNVTFQQAAAVPIAAVTALQALRDKGELKAGQQVLINGASGGVGTFAVQIAKAMGAEVTGVCSTRNVELVRGLGADRVIDYTKESFTERAETYDLVVDMVGNHPPSKVVDVLRPDGRLVLVGGDKGNWIAPFVGPVKALLLNNFVDQQLATLLAELNSSDLQALAELMQSGSVVPVVDRQYALADIKDAIRYSESGRARGKIIVDMD